MNKLFRRANDWDKADKAQLTDGIKNRGIKTTESRAIEAEEEKKRE